MSQPPSSRAPVGPSPSRVPKPSPTLAPRARTDALSRVRHDMRSVIHSVLGYSDLLERELYGELNGDQRRFVSHLRGAAEQLQELVDACIELSRPALSLSPPSVQPLSLVQGLDRLQSSLRERGLACDLVRESGDERSLNVDFAGLERALLALALVATREAAVSCELSCLPSDGPLHLRMRASDAPEHECCAGLDQLEAQTPNREFVRLKLAETLLLRQGVLLRMSPALDTFELEFSRA